MTGEKETFEVFTYQNREYRVIADSPSGLYRLGQRSDYPASGPFGASADDPIALFRTGKDQTELIAQVYGPYELEDGPFLFDVVWRDSFVVLVFSAIEQSGTAAVKIPYDGKTE